MELKEAIRSRKSVRQFKDTPVSQDIIKDILENAKWAASGGNLQPWQVHVLGGVALDELKNEVQQKMLRRSDGNTRVSCLSTRTEGSIQDPPPCGGASTLRSNWRTS